MDLRTAILAGLAVLVIALPGLWLFAPSVFTEVRALLDTDHRHQKPSF